MILVPTAPGFMVLVTLSAPTNKLPSQKQQISLFRLPCALRFHACHNQTSPSGSLVDMFPVSSDSWGKTPDPWGFIDLACRTALEASGYEIAPVDPRLTYDVLAFLNTGLAYKSTN